MSTLLPSALDSVAYPDIIDNVLDHLCDSGSKPAIWARLVCRPWYDRINETLFKQVRLNWDMDRRSSNRQAAPHFMPSQTTPAIDFGAYPHIMDAVVDMFCDSSPQSAVTARLVCRHWYRRINRSVFKYFSLNLHLWGATTPRPPPCLIPVVASYHNLSAFLRLLHLGVMYRLLPTQDTQILDVRTGMPGASTLSFLFSAMLNLQVFRVGYELLDPPQLRATEVIPKSPKFQAPDPSLYTVTARRLVAHMISMDQICTLVHLSECPSIESVTVFSAFNYRGYPDPTLFPTVVRVLVNLLAHFAIKVVSPERWTPGDTIDCNTYPDGRKRISPVWTELKRRMEGATANLDLEPGRLQFLTAEEYCAQVDRKTYLFHAFLDSV